MAFPMLSQNKNKSFGIRTIFCIIHFSMQTVKLCSPELQFPRIKIISKVSKGLLKTHCVRELWPVSSKAPHESQTLLGGSMAEWLGHHI